MGEKNNTPEDPLESVSNLQPNLLSLRGPTVGISSGKIKYCLNLYTLARPRQDTENRYLPRQVRSLPPDPSLQLWSPDSRCF